MYDRTRETSSTNGTGTISLLGAVTGYQSFAVSVGDGNQSYYTIADQTGGNWEVGIGTYTLSGSTLSRTTVLSSSNSNALVSFGSNVKDVFVTCPATILTEIGTGGGTVTSFNTGAGLTGGPITTTGTVAVNSNGITAGLFRQSNSFSLVGNPTNATANVADISLGSGLSFSGNSLVAAVGTGTVTQVNTGTGLVGGPINTTGTISLNSPVVVANGGTGLMTLPNGAVLIGNGTSVVNFAVTGTNGQLLIDQGSGNNPAFEPMSGDAVIAKTGAITVSKTNGTSFAPSATIDATNAGNITNGTLVVAHGGTSINSTSPYALLCGGTNSTAPLQQVGSLGNSGYVLTSNGNGSLPVWTSPSSGGTVTSITAGTGLNGGTITTSGTFSLNSPVVVANGGTGNTSLTAYAVLCGGTNSTAALQQVSGLGTNGQVLTSAGAGALPAWQPGGGGSGTVNSGTTPQVAWYASNGTTVSGRAGRYALFTMTATATVVNTGTETTLIGSGTGSLTIPTADIIAGKTVRFRAMGYWSSLGAVAGNVTFNFKAGSNVLATSGAVAVPLSLSNDYWEVTAEITIYSIGGSGTVWTQGKFLSETPALGAFVAGMVTTTPSNFAGTPLTNPLDLTITWSVPSSSNTITCTNVAVDTIN
jgi:hypothetical protein